MDLADAKDARCMGLLGRQALKKSNNAVVNASSTTKESGPFYCPDCLSDAIVRKCYDKEDHFAHKARMSKLLTSKDQELHTKCINDLLEYAKSAFPEFTWLKEHTIPVNEKLGTKELRPDLCGRINKENRVVIEIQKSTYSVKKIIDKTLEYAKWDLYVLWIVPLLKELGDEPYRPRLMEKFFHSLYFGKIYYYHYKSPAVIIPVHLSPVKRYIEEKTWFNEQAEEQNTGGYYLTYRTLKLPNYGKFMMLHKDFYPKKRKKHSNKDKKYNIPECNIVLDNHQSWWSKDEFKDIDSQFEKIKEQIPQLADYNMLDDFDEEEYEDDL